MQKEIKTTEEVKNTTWIHCLSKAGQDQQEWCPGEVCTPLEAGNLNEVEPGWHLEAHPVEDKLKVCRKVYSQVFLEEVDNLQWAGLILQVLVCRRVCLVYMKACRRAYLEGVNIHDVGELVQLILACKMVCEVCKRVFLEGVGSHDAVGKIQQVQVCKKVWGGDNLHHGVDLEEGSPWMELHSLHMMVLYNLDEVLHGVVDNFCGVVHILHV